MYEKSSIEIVGIAATVIAIVAMLAAFCTPAMAGCQYDVSTSGTGSYGTSDTLTNGTIYVDGKGASVLGHKPPVEHVEFATIPGGTVEWARVYWHIWGGRPEYWGRDNATFCNATDCWHNNRTLPGGMTSCQQNSITGWYKGGCGTHWLYWDVTDKVQSGEQHNISIDNTIPPGTWDGRTMWVYLVVALDELDGYTGPKVTTKYWINQGYEDLDEDEQSTTLFGGSASTTTNGTLWHHGLCSDITEGGIWFSGHNLRTDVPGDLTEEEIDASWIKTSNNNMTWDNGNDPYYHPVMAMFMDKRPLGKDLIVTDIELPDMMRPSTAYTVKATVKNRGSLDVTNQFVVGLYLDGSGTAHDTENIAGLNAGDSTTVSFSTQVNLASGCHEFKVVADTGNAVSELGEGNNEKKVDKQVGNVIVVKKNSDFDTLDYATKTGNVYYIEDLTIENCAGAGISIENTDVAFVINNCTVHNCAGSAGSGIFLNNLSSGTINGSTIQNNMLYGLKVGEIAQPDDKVPELVNITNNTIESNIIDGIDFVASNGTVSNNTIQNNHNYAIYMDGTGNEIYGNYIISNNIDYPSHTSQAYSYGTNNDWDSNYWSDYTGVDENDDGYGDTDYDINYGEKDDSPLCFRDLVISNVWVNWPTDCTIYYNITNMGRRIVTPSHNTLLSVDNAEKALDTVTEDLSAGESYHGSFSGYTWACTAGKDDIQVCADINGSIGEELGEGNNCSTDTWMCGDATGDGNVRGSDKTRLGNYLAEVPGYTLSSEWAADVTGDGNIRGSDKTRLGNYLAEVPGYLLTCRC